MSQADRISLVVVVGATAVGKSAVSMALAESLETEIVSADSRQIYRGMDIGTAKPNEDCRRRIPHHLIDIRDPDEKFSVGEFKRLADQAIEGIWARGKVPLVSGGTGLYVRALIRGLWEGPPADWAVRGRLRQEELAEPGALHQKLVALDPAAAHQIQPSDLPKLIRALEVFYITGSPISEHHRAHRFQKSAYRAVIVGLRRERGDLYDRINRRVDEMISGGLVEELNRLRAKGYGLDLGSMKGLGYHQFSDYLEGKLSLDEAANRLKRDTRRYAKRQETWYRKEASVVWLDLKAQEDPKGVSARIMDLIRRANLMKERSA